MLRRLGLGAKGDDETENGVHPETQKSAVLAPPVDHHRQTRFFKVVYRGRVGVRLTPTRPAPEEGQRRACGNLPKNLDPSDKIQVVNNGPKPFHVKIPFEQDVKAVNRNPERMGTEEDESFGYGDVIEVCGLAVAVPEGVLVEVKQGGWVFQRHESQTVLEEVDPLKVVEGQWWYRVVHPAGAHFVKIPSLQPKAPRYATPVPQGTVVRACRKHTPPGSSVTFVELSDNRGWVIESTADGSVLEHAGDGKVVLEHITGEFRDESEAWYRTVANPGVELLGGPDINGLNLLEMFLTGKTFCVSERFQPEGQDWVYLKLKDREAWVPCNNDQEDFCEKLPPAVDEVVEKWYRVEYPGGVRLRASPWFEHTHPSLGVLVCGWVFLVTRRYRAPGSSHMFLQVATPEGVVRELPDTPYNESENGFRGSALSNGDAGKSAVPKAGLGEARPESGWVPSSSNGVEVVKETTEPWIEKGLSAYQVVASEPLEARDGPHENAPVVAQQLDPYNVAAVATFLETGDGEEGFVQLARSGAWVQARRGKDVKMVRLPDFPIVDTTPRHFVVSALEGVETIAGPSSAASGTGNILPYGTEGRSGMVWTIKDWPGARGKGGLRFVLLEQKGWVKIEVTRRVAQDGGGEDPDAEQSGTPDDFLQGGDVLREVDVASSSSSVIASTSVEPEDSS